MRLEQRLRQAEKMEAVGRLAGGIAHDFNNILGGILGYAEMLVESTAAGTSERRYAQNVLTAATRASSLVEQILSYSRSQRGKRIPVEIDRIIAETLELVNGSLGASIRLETRLPAAPLYVVGDPTQLHQIMTLIAENPPPRVHETGPAFATPTIVHFSAALLLSALVRIPWDCAEIVKKNNVDNGDLVFPYHRS